MSDYCEHDGDPASCPPCNAVRPAPVSRRAYSVPQTSATYPGRCPGCDDRIHEGDTIYRVDDEWICEACL